MNIPQSKAYEADDQAKQYAPLQYFEFLSTVGRKQYEAED